MQVYQYLAIGFRLLAIVIFIYSLKQWALFLAVVFTDVYAGMPASPYFFLAMAAIPLIAAAVLWLFPTKIAKKVVPPSSDVSVIPEKSFSIFVALLITFGVIVLFYVLVDVIYWATYLHLLTSNQEAYETASNAMQNNKANFIATTFELIAALFIISRAKYLASFLYNSAR
jgi:hypothetical protein